MLELLSSPEAWAAFVTLSVMEVVLGIDNIIFMSIVIGRLSPAEAPRALRIGLLLAFGLRIAMLFGITWIIALQEPLFTLPFGDAAAEGGHMFDPAISWRDLILIGGGLFLIVKATREIHQEIEHEEHVLTAPAKSSSFFQVIAQIALINIIFSIDSILTAIGMANDVPVMIAAVVVSIIVMYFASAPVTAFIKRNPTTLMLALAFLLLIGVALIADGLGFHIPRGYIYFSMAFAALVEVFNVLARRARKMVG
jgi:predicted tellurium resistance membrane protein TerC